MTLRPTSKLSELRERTGGWKADGQRVGLVPTMGNLHAGHLALVDQLASSCDRVVVSIFVNPTQFGPGEDFESYPRTLEDDLKALHARGVALVWAPRVSTMYPLDDAFLIQVPDALANTLCGRDRPGHFNGVASVVLRLLLQVMPDAVIFGEKDFQQLLILRQLVTDYALSIEVEAMQTVREVDGLAMSSRNQYLTEAERRKASELYSLMQETVKQLKNGVEWSPLQTAALSKLKSAGFRPQYFELRSAETLAEPMTSEPRRLFAAAHLGKARLIDNFLV